MTAQDWAKCEALLRANWPHDLKVSEAGMRKRRFDVDDFPVEQVLVAIEAIHRDGDRDWMPRGAVIRNKLLELTLDLPDWGQVLAALRKLASRGAFYPRGQGGPDDEGRDEILDRLGFDARLAGVIRGFAESIGWPQIQAGLSADGGDEARLRDKYNAYIQRGKRELAYRGLDPAGLPVLERVSGSNGSPRQIGDVVKELTQ